MIITGGAGFIGSNLAEALAAEGKAAEGKAAEGNEIVVIDDLSAGHAENLAGIDVRLVLGSILDRGLLRRELEGTDTVFHLAAVASVQRSVESPLLVNEINLNGTLEVLNAARNAGVQRVVFASTAAVYGISPDLPKREDMRPDPRSPYAVTKLAGEYYASIFQELYGLEAVTLRFFNVFGPKQDPSSEYSGVISRFISAIMKEEQPVIFGDGEQTRDFVFVKDVVRACILASKSRSTGVFNVARGQSTSLNQLLMMLGRIAGRRVSPRYAPARAGDIKHSLADISKAEKIGYRPKHSVEEGLRRTVEWFLASSKKVGNK